MLAGYMAISADGYVADAEGGVGFLDPFNDIDYGYEDFAARLDAVILGRRTYDQTLGFGVPWPYAGKTGHIVTSTDLGDAPEGVNRWTGTLAEYAAAMADRLSWVVGGAKLQAAFLAEGLLDRLELFVMPVLLGRGVPLFPHDGAPVRLRLADQNAWPNGVVRLDYRKAA
ncbi:dihydrofolate reductase [Rhodobacterales bacterium HKCCE3408]|nr:dihydrofolate reductase [Rhodobacterales bacterium HKCCE3408]